MTPNGQPIDGRVVVADTHALHAVEQTVGERMSIDPDFGHQRLAVVLEPCDADRPPSRGASG